MTLNLFCPNGHRMSVLSSHKKDNEIIVIFQCDDPDCKHQLDHPLSGISQADISSTPTAQVNLRSY